MTRLMLGLPAPAKLNLFLHVTGRREDGFHELRTGFVAIDLADTLDFELIEGGRIERQGDLAGPVEQDLAVRAARLLQQEAGCDERVRGVRIDVEKRIPTGSGLGGGSSDAATTLIALNRLWRLNWNRERLATLAVRLGADVPFFLQPGPALGEGIGERLSPLATAVRWYAVIHPQVHVSTAEIFKSAELTAHLKQAKIQGFPEGGREANTAADAPGVGGAGFGSRWEDGGNDLEPIVRGRVPEVDAALRYLAGFGMARMTGSGASVFAAFETETQARRAIAGAPAGWSTWAVAGLSEHPLASW
ncbi:MAG TPA: 4-(cytidine 5'-diphospho)-2-C-methyl-D-erythritol kinase [Burkholderiaceae bacterium]|nr:4-(cytidine 5'-diphospho)-2-C-methyl-D-erythritol kinase [Burkholderiaceae bacterium]